MDPRAQVRMEVREAFKTLPDQAKLDLIRTALMFIPDADVAAFRSSAFDAGLLQRR